ncbi:MAG TPA: Xaa-Pro peptidase family protein [Acidimicrobiia bacterium]|nr:Xaa-Pro peptidase family protein [Acidimicrobiia bacterium]
MRDYEARITRARAEMEREGISVLLLSVGTDLPYLTGYEAMPLERLTMLVLPIEGGPVMIVPELEAPRVEHGSFELRPWRETEDPLRLVADLVGPVGTAAVNDQLWSVFLLGLLERLPTTRFVSATSITRPLRVRKDADEVDALRAAGGAADRVVARLREERFAGRSELEMARLVAAMTVEEGHDQATFWIVASGPNGASPHHDPGNRVMEQGDLVVVDFGGKVRRYGSDCTRTFSIGPPAQEQVEVHAAVMTAQQAATAAVRPGVAAELIDHVARKVIAETGYGEYFIHRTGHGIGLDAHEHPYLVEGNSERLEAGMCFSIEPGIYLPGRFGVRIEDIVAVTNEGVEALNKADRSLVEVG